MKKALTQTLLFCLILLAIGQSVLAQSPFQFNYQGTARDQAGVPLANHVLRIRITIRNGSAIGPAEYSETRGVVTNKYGLFNFAIGSPGAIYSSGTLQGVDWAAGNKYMQVEMDAEGNNNFVDMGATQLMSVPYALYAMQSGSGRLGILANNGVTLADSTIQLGNKVGDTIARFYEDREVPLNKYNLFFNEGRVSINTNSKAYGFLTVHSTDPQVPALSLTGDRTPLHYQTIMVHKSSEIAQSGTALDWSFNMQDYPNVQHDGIAHPNNTVYQYGWNISPWGDRADNTKPAFLHSFEQRYTIGGYGDCSEYHVVGINKQGKSRRHWSVLSSHDGYNSYMYWTSNFYSWNADNGNSDETMMALSRNGTLAIYGDDSKLDFARSGGNAGSPLIRQRNNAGNRYYGLLGLNAHDELQLGSIETPVWIQHGFLRLGGYNKTYGAIFNERDYIIHVGVPESSGPWNYQQINSYGLDMLRLKSWSTGMTWVHGIDDYSNFYIKDQASGKKYVTVRKGGGLLVPTYTTAERNALRGLNDGELIYNKDAVNEDGTTGVFEFYQSSTRSWASFDNSTTDDSKTAVVKQIAVADAQVYTVSASDYTIELAEITANSEIVLPDPSTCKGRVLILWNGNESLAARWKTNLPVYETPKRSFDIIPNSASLQIQSDGTRWIKVN